MAACCVILSKVRDHMKLGYMLETPKTLGTFMVKILRMEQWAISREGSKENPQRLHARHSVTAEVKI